MPQGLAPVLTQMQTTLLTPDLVGDVTRDTKKQAEEQRGFTDRGSCDPSPQTKKGVPSPVIRIPTMGCHGIPLPPSCGQRISYMDEVPIWNG